jgi:20S proteasome subunit alpha 7
MPLPIVDVSPSCAQALAERLGLYVQVYTLYSSVRPFGCSTILGGIDKDGPSIYVIEPSGVFYVRVGPHRD